MRHVEREARAAARIGYESAVEELRRPGSAVDDDGAAVRLRFPRPPQSPYAEDAMSAPKVGDHIDSRYELGRPLAEGRDRGA